MTVRSTVLEICPAFQNHKRISVARDSVVYRHNLLWFEPS